jgi:DNA replication protein DnaD
MSENKDLNELIEQLNAEMNRDAKEAVKELQKQEYMDLKKYIQEFNDTNGFMFSVIPMDKLNLMHSIVSPDKHSGFSYACLWKKIKANLNSSN